MNRRVAGTLVLVGSALAASASSIVGMLAFSFGVCHVFDDTGGPFPANDSPQGQVCGGSAYASPWEELAIWSIPATGLLSVLLMLAAWRWGRGLMRSAAVTGLFALPVLAVVPLALPSDACSAEDAERPIRDCTRES